MPGPGNSRIPTLSTFAEIGRFCNPVTTTSTAVICNTSLRSVIQELLENARTKAFNTGRKEGYDEGRYLANEDEEKGRDTALEEGKNRRVSPKLGMYIRGCARPCNPAAWTIRAFLQVTGSNTNHYQTCQDIVIMAVHCLP
jgi:hypothetical protein